MAHVFVYGTLLSGESNHHIAAPYVTACRPGKVKGWLYDCGPYPGLVLDPRGMNISGEWLTVRDEGLADIDRLEGYEGPGGNNEYERVWVRDEEQAMSGWVYVWESSRGFPLVTGGSWTEWRRQSGKNS